MESVLIQNIKRVISELGPLPNFKMADDGNSSDLVGDTDELEKYYGFKKHHIYKISPIIQNQNLKNKKIVFSEFRKQGTHDITRAVVNLLNHDGSNGEEYLLMPNLIVQL